MQAEPSRRTCRLKHLLFSALLASLLSTSTVAVLAQDAPAAPAAPVSKGEQLALLQFKLLDTNQDGKLSRDEVSLVPRLAQAFDAADTNHDGFVDLEEIRAFTLTYRAQRDAAKKAAAAATQD